MSSGEEEREEEKVSGCEQSEATPGAFAPWDAAGMLELQPERYICDICSPLGLSFQRQAPFRNTIANNKLLQYLSVFTQTHTGFLALFFQKMEWSMFRILFTEIFMPSLEGWRAHFSTHSLCKINMKTQAQLKLDSGCICLVEFCVQKIPSLAKEPF